MHRSCELPAYSPQKENINKPGNINSSNQNINKVMKVYPEPPKKSIPETPTYNVENWHGVWTVVSKLNIKAPVST